jgi:hypothetical protein
MKSTPDQHGDQVGPAAGTPQQLRLKRFSVFPEKRIDPRRKKIVKDKKRK